MAMGQGGDGGERACSEDSFIPSRSTCTVHSVHTMGVENRNKPLITDQEGAIEESALIGLGIIARSVIAQEQHFYRRRCGGGHALAVRGYNRRKGHTVSEYSIAHSSSSCCDFY